ncbi:uncharacterized protein LOC128890314 isoform X1 [Hylaeus anthracinus]|uniref:uncharacterized protein LOC128890314 isoform X1 n=2 Tax=Hylaeus anthracinus TaxID=313031 RepID=UPI0023B9E5CF|nr:uncharacterized protein LOC128890314 isoform X1 [Hylaeus anthracinus]
MVEDSKTCVLQWAGHAGYVTEKFSELFARQAFVDVTLVCEEQKLRVHKMVLASNSTYFEEILQHDLGREPIIFLKDLSFKILKAMVEFMYCGETVIPRQLLSSLLAATKTYKVKELTTIVNAMMTSNIINIDGNTNTDKRITESKVRKNKYNKDNIHVKCDELDKDECFLLCNENSSNVELSENKFFESNIIIDTPEQEMEHMLYEDTQDLDTNVGQKDTPFSVSSSVKSIENHNLTPSKNYEIKEASNRCSESSISRGVMCTNDALKPILYEQCCDLSDIDECEEGSMSLSQTCIQQIEKDFAQYNFEGIDVPNKVGKCIKVYTHKRRKSIDEIKTKLTDVNNVIQSPPSTDCIDLLDEPSANDIPVTLLTSLDMESAEYIISLSTENIQSIVGVKLNEQHTLNDSKELDHIIEFDNQKDNINKKELNLENSEHSDYIKPILRRSSRLNHQEIEETINNNETVREYHGREKQLKKSNGSNKVVLCAKRKRKIKDTDHKVPEQSINNITQANKKTFNNSRKNTAKLIVKRNNKPTCTISSKEKDEQTTKIMNTIKCDISETTEIDSIFTLPKLNTLEHINRSLWGDMSDFPEDFENRMDLLEYTSNTEIPFAVGLLPLRTALEKMQATPDYQPRKTRSSVAPIKQDGWGLKRKSCTYPEKVTVSKKQNGVISDTKENANTVCHIQIRTAPSQDVRNRKKYFTPDVGTLEASTIINKQ